MKERYVSFWLKDMKKGSRQIEKTAIEYLKIGLDSSTPEASRGLNPADEDIAVLLCIDDERRFWDFMLRLIKPDDICGLNYQEPGVGIGGRHFCIDKRGHEGACTCHCGYHWPKEQGVRP